MLADVIVILLAIFVFAVAAVAVIIATNAIVPLYVFFVLGLAIAVLFAFLRQAVVPTGRRG